MTPKVRRTQRCAPSIFANQAAATKLPLLAFAECWQRFRESITLPDTRTASGTQIADLSALCPDCNY